MTRTTSLLARLALAACLLLASPEGVARAEDGTAGDVPYDNVRSGLAASDVQGAIDELDAKLDQSSSMHSDLSNLGMDDHPMHPVILPAGDDDPLDSDPTARPPCDPVRVGSASDDEHRAFYFHRTTGEVFGCVRSGRSPRWVKIGPEVLLARHHVSEAAAGCETSGAGCCVDGLGGPDAAAVACASASSGRERLSFGGPAVVRRICLRDRSETPDPEEGCSISLDVDERGAGSWAKRTALVARYGGAEADFGYDGTRPRRRIFCRDLFLVLDSDDELRIRYHDPVASAQCSGASGRCACGGGDAAGPRRDKAHVIHVYGTLF